MLKLRKNKKGFTLVELIVVIAIMAVLAGTVAGVTVTQLNKAKNDSALSDIKTLLGEFESFLASYDTSSITNVDSAKIAVAAFGTEKEAAKGLASNYGLLTYKSATTEAAGNKSGTNKYAYNVTVESGKLTLTIWCDKVGSTGADPKGTRTYEL